jgi:uncharacterized repeat protein (TIGR01451 family)
VAILKSVTPGVVFPGETVTYTIAFSNAGLGTAFGVIISDSVPVSVTGLSVTNSGAPIFDLGAPPDFVWGLEGLEPGQDGIITITGQISPALTGGGLFTNTAEIVTFGSETDTGNNTSGAGVQIAQLGLEADLAISKSRLGPNTVLPGSAITYTVTLTNNGPDSVNVTVTDTYTGAVVSGVNTTAAGGSCSSPVSPIICSFADFTGSATITFVFSTNPGLTGILSNSAAISPTNGLDPFPDNNQTGTITTSVAGVVQLPLVSFGVIAPTPLPEGDTAAVQISLDIASTQAITVSYGVSGGTATPGVDFIPLSGQLVFPAGTTVQTLTVTAISDSLNEGDETVELQLTAPQNAVLAADPLTATLTILDTTPQSPVSVIYLPLVMKENLVAPDLIVDVLLAATDGVTVVIKNVGNASVFNSFWVDAYVNPDPPPAGVNDVWHDGRSVEGVAWGVDDPLLAQLTPGGAITLTIDSAHPDFTVLDGFTPGDVVYVQVDSANLTATYGGVLEGHEISGGPYNNIVQTVVNPGPPAQIRSQWQFNAPTGDSLPDRPSNLLRYQHQYKLQIP